ncbi:anthranilate N-benzoyltransferase protein 1-like [Camellia sinensis]|uniref:anthranilate N-benzoyltransferase protein 1-like n=1 Tax=Camellia sinensis TaxID=4442 RepID=UPI001035B4C6|nr:anthranilate N-benzoyltransferase protein 1-like [Camellia sinensis]
MSSNGGFTVVIKRREVVAAVLPMQEHWLPMSNLDLLVPPLDVGVFFCYKKAPIKIKANEDSRVTILKKALAQALNSFYVFAGEVVENGLGEPEVLCNNRGVDFIYAYADVELRNVDLHHPHDSVHGKFVPSKNQGVLCIQATELKCGGLVIGCTFDHQVADAYSANMFFVSWAEIALAKPISQIPCFRRSLPNPRRPGYYDRSIDNIYVFLSSLPPPKLVEDPEPNEDSLQSRIYYVVSEELNYLQSQATSSNDIKRSKLVSFSAFLWKLIASAEKSKSESGSNSNKRCKMGVVVDGRGRLTLNNNIKADHELEKYFGNILSIPYGEASVGELNAMHLSKVAELVHDCLEGAATEEHFLGLIDWVEFHRPEKAIVRVYCKETDDETAMVVSSGQRFPVSKIDFGWGKPSFGSYHFPWGGKTGYVMPMPSTSRDGDWILYMHLREKHLDFVESQAPHLFRPLTPAYLNLTP